MSPHQYSVYIIKNKYVYSNIKFALMKNFHLYIMHVNEKKVFIYLI